MRRRLAIIRETSRLLYVRWYRRLRMNLWFPQVPLALAVGGAGIIALLPSVWWYAAVYLNLNLTEVMKALHPVSGQIPTLILTGVPITAVGVLQILIAIGLLARSRIAWLSALVIAVVQLILILHRPEAQLSSGQVAYMLVLLLALLAGRDRFDRSSLAANTLLAVASLIILVVYGIIGSLLLGADFKPPITDLTGAFYFTIVTMTTVGYGDIVPVAPEARLFVVSLIVFGLTLFATALTAVVGPVVQNRINQAIGNRRHTMERVNHYIITGDGPLARNTARELRERDQPVLVIIEKEDPSLVDVEIAIGDPTELDMLRKAGALHARAVLALSDNDSENAFVVLAVRELRSEARTVAAVSSRKNLERVRWVHPDMVFAAPVFGSEALVMALTDEQIDRDWLLSRFLDVKPEGG
jgi:voltage-gated potassium channel